MLGRTAALCACLCLSLAATGFSASVPDMEAMTLQPDNGPSADDHEPVLPPEAELRFEGISTVIKGPQEAGAATGPATDANPMSASGGGDMSETGGTGGTGGTGATGATGATGPVEVELPEDVASVRMSVQLLPILLSEFDETKKKIFSDTVADKLSVLKKQVVVTNVAAHVGQRRRLMGAKVVGSGGIDVMLVVEQLSMAKAQTTASNLNSLFADTSDEGGAAALGKAGLNVKTCTVTDKATVDGPSKPKDGCVAHVMEELTRLHNDNLPESKWPDSMKTYCHKAFEKKSHLLKVNAQIVSRTCERGFGIFARIPEGQRYNKATTESKNFCFEMRHFFESLVRSVGGKNMTHGMATNVADINRQAPGQGVTACCVPHMQPGCFDKKVQECVCTGNGKFKKKDNFCCNTEWDVTCTENVEWFHCAGCPQPELFLELAPARSPLRTTSRDKYDGMALSSRPNHHELAEPVFWIGL